MADRLPRLFIGPWVGEFGVEVLRWQGMARALAQSRPWQEVIVCSHPARELLYRDFADRFVGIQAPGANTIGFGCDGDADDSIHEHFIDLSAGDVLFSPRLEHIQRRVVYGMSAARSLYRNFGAGLTPPPRRYDILIHARATMKANQAHKNWPARAWEDFVDLLPAGLQLASIGARAGAHKIRGTDDLRDVSLDELARLCASARVMVGPSSGPIHFAMHCGLAAVTWVDSDPHHNARLDARCNYHPAWNPWDVHLCCLLGWQPEPALIAFKTRELLELMESAQKPVRYAVFGTKRSGHHAVLEWLTQLSPTTRFTHWNDCICEGMETFPFADYVHPTKRLLPKTLQQAERIPTVMHWNDSGTGKAERILSFEGLEIEKIARLPEVRAAERLVFVLRDGANLAAALRQGVPELQRRRFLAPEFLGIMRVYRGYLLEALGRTNHLGDLRRKAVFVSYNRWHMDEQYRRETSRLLVGVEAEVPRGLHTAHSHPSGFQPSSTPADALRTLARWRHFAHDDGFWNLACDPEYFDAEREFHSPYYLLGLDPPLRTGVGPTLPDWAL